MKKTGHKLRICSLFPTQLCQFMLTGAGSRDLNVAANCMLGKIQQLIRTHNFSFFFIIAAVCFTLNTSNDIQTTNKFVLLF